MEQYKYIKKIGAGGNGVVNLVKNSKGEEFAQKVLKNISEKAYQRFKDEIEVLSKLNNKDGIIPLIDFYFPETIDKNNPPYYIMPVCVDLKEYLETLNLEKMYSLLFDICRSIKYLHSNDIAHRDIKPENILILDNKPVIADFGLVTFPHKKDISNKNEKIGPKWTIAPEMERISSVAEYKKADIYSLAKTIWMIITKQWQGFEGQYIAHSNISVNNFVKLCINESSMAGVWHYHSLVLLDKLLIQATDNDPDKRPNIDAFLEDFEYWYSSNKEYKERNTYEWKDAIDVIFPVSIPMSCRWTDIDDIFNILKIIFQNYDQLNHCFYPEYGGTDFYKISISSNGECLVINDDLLIKPKALYFELTNDIDWSYFQLEIMKQSPINTENHCLEEDVFFNADLSQESEFEETDFNEYSRCLDDSYIITKKTSNINFLPGELDAYGAIHSTMSREDYRNLMLKLSSKYNRNVDSYKPLWMFRKGS